MNYETKLKIAKLISKKKLSERQIIQKYKTSKGMISRIKKTIVPFLEQGTVNTDEDPMPYCEKSKFGDQVFEIFQKLREDKVPISGPFIKKIALYTASKIGFDSFKASNGWLDRFKKRHELRFKLICGEKNSSDLTYINEFFKILDEKIAEYGRENVFNCDETALYIKRTPRKSFVGINDDTFGFNPWKGVSVDKISKCFQHAKWENRIEEPIMGDHKIKNFEQIIEKLMITDPIKEKEFIDFTYSENDELHEFVQNNNYENNDENAILDSSITEDCERNNCITHRDAIKCIFHMTIILM
ncbi:tigger transposable element-derived protein 6-like [Octopus sinensis]|uniref:Tigger transposable element-derived protein 6-like n=1 Tax=Octopus sinensis TaxID=2607531 RepID=A0A6P7U1J6_9MOLL|nr:tigger transposable element-derived protein 6-like [Octopus sinensis]